MSSQRETGTAPLFVVGMGPGSDAYLTPAAEQAIAGASILVGAERHLDRYAPSGKELVPFAAILSDLAGTLADLRSRGTVAVLVSGDPGFHSLLERIRAHLDPAELEVVPGISSVQLACARLGVSWQNMQLLSAHGRPVESVVASLADGSGAAILTDPGHGPGTIARAMLAAGLPDRRAWVFEDLSYESERITETMLSDLPEKEFGPLTMLVLDGH